jgi:apolipoprotein D and lipocalin family protein
MGDWYVIANIPYFAEKGCIDSVESYALRDDGRIDNEFAFRKESFKAPVQKIRALGWVHDKKSNAEWRVRFLGFLTVKYLVLDLDKDYRWAVIGHPMREYGWVLGREKTLSDTEYDGILGRLATQGYDRARFEKVPQLPDQLAKG